MQDVNQTLNFSHTAQLNDSFEPIFTFSFQLGGGLVDLHKYTTQPEVEAILTAEIMPAFMLYYKQMILK